MSIAEKFEVIADEVFLKGKKAFWDGYLKQMREGKDAMYLFAGQSWNDETFYPTENIIPKKSGTGLFAYFSWYVAPYIDLAERLEKCGVSLDTSQCTNLTQLFSNCFVTRLPKISAINANTLTQTFVNMSVLKIIDELNLRGETEIDEGKAYNTFDRTFNSCAALEDITVTGIIGNNISFADCSKLTSVSVDSIIEALRTLAEGDAARTVTFHTTVKGNMTDSQKAIIQEKGWTLA